MKKINIVKKNDDFKRIMDNNKCLKNNDFLIFVEKNEVIQNYKFGISVSKKLGNAVLRNKLKRQIKSIIDEKSYQYGFNCIIILRKGVLTKNYFEIRESLYNLLNKIDIFKGDINEK